MREKDVTAARSFLQLMIVALLSGCSAPMEVTATHTPDPCTGWTCSVSGVVISGENAQPLEGASVALHQASYCSPTRGDRQAATDAAGRFEFADVFLHDTDRIQLVVEAPGHSPAQWDSRDLYCLYCNCFAEPLELTLERTP